MAGPIRVEEFAAWFVRAFVSVRAEEIPLGLEQVGWKHCGTVAVVERECRAECRYWNAALGSLRHDVAPAFLASLDLATEIFVEQNVAKFRILIEGLFNFSEEA